MSTLSNIWNNYTLEFSTIQKIIIAIVLGVIILVALAAFVLIILEFTK